MSAVANDERASRLLRRLDLDGEVLHDRISGRALVLNTTARGFFDVLQRHGTGNAAITAIADQHGITLERAETDFAAFLDLIDQGQRCVGSVLPGEHHAVLEPTAVCNGQCPHCYHGTRSDHWPRGRTDDILRRIASAGVRSVSVTGGEVFGSHFVDGFFELVDGLEAVGVSLASVSTNATFLTEGVRDRVLERLPRSTVFRISLDALRSSLLDRVRPGYRNLADPYGPIRDLDAAGFPLVFTTNLWPQTPDEVIEIGEYLRQYTQVEAWNVRLAVPVHHGGNTRTRASARQRQLLSAPPSPRLPLRHYAAILRAHANHPLGFPVRLGNYLMTSALSHPQTLTPHDPGHPCREDADLITVKANGRVTQCPILTELDATLTSGPVWDDADALARGPLRGLHTDAMECATCALRSVCGGGCRLYALAYDRGITGCDQPARSLLSWMLADPTGLLRDHWPRFHARLLDLLPEANPGELYQAYAAGWDQ